MVTSRIRSGYVRDTPACYTRDLYRVHRLDLQQPMGIVLPDVYGMRLASLLAHELALPSDGQTTDGTALPL